MNRKEFFTSAGRLLMLGGIVASAGYLVSKNKITATCSVSPTCTNCGKVAVCINPEIKTKRGEIK